MTPTLTDADRIAALTAERDAEKEIARIYQAERDEANELATQMRKRAEKAEAERDKDAERLDWLNANPREATVRVGTEMHACVFYGISCDPKWSAREAIDAAIRESKP